MTYIHTKNTNSRTASIIGSCLRTAAVISILGLAVGGVQAQQIDYPSYHWKEPTYGAFLKELKTDFESKNPGVTIKDTFVPYTSYVDQMYIDITAGNAPDILTSLDPDFKRYIDADLLEPLDAYLEAAGYSIDDFIAPAQLAVKDGHIYGIPFLTNPRALFVNKKMLDKAGLPLPTNLEEFNKVVSALRDPSTQTFGVAISAQSGAPGMQFLEYAPYFASFGAKFFTEGKPTADTPEMIKALTFYKDIVDQGLVPKGAKFDIYRPMFMNGKIAMYVAGPFMGALTQSTNAETYSDLVTIPLQLGGGKPLTVTNYLAIPKNAKNKDASAKLLMTILQDDWQKRIVALTNTIPGRKGMVPDSILAENAWFKTFAELGDSATSYAPEGAEQYGSDIINIIGGHIERMLFTGVPAEQVSTEMQADLVKFIESK
ncbi:ABC transporter substrate-binding protein [Oryzicola mucosus]|uniref:Sugar ABC transporter substrate-binding protein n=1 Tax=Oryzicola mucosus TaxID=2767425 RepID=A0A8J6PLN4_9HYPH|nr:sugar ABC transporter substrate-binding protein [Oryzicola mucosus]MBD0416793.1 sugar ABC transporter substrate-binding protein [Oryzicola mucosus]